MLHRVFFVCLSLSLYSAGCALSCRWVDHKFRQYSGTSLRLLHTMANVDAAAENTLAFPRHLYASIDSAEDKLAFAVQVLEETADLFEEDYSTASWEENTVDNFVSVITQQADGLQSCIGSHERNIKLHTYFKRLSRNVLRRKGHSAEAWELIRREIKEHLRTVDLLVTSLINTN